MPTQTSETYDGIILGSGHNSLVLQAYLGKAGLKVLCLESRDVAGGGLATVEDPRHPGFLHNTHSFFHRGLTQMPWYCDLELERHGAVYLEPELNVALVRVLANCHPQDAVRKGILTASSSPSICASTVLPIPP